MTGTAMSLERARKIVGAICQRNFVSIGLHDGPVTPLAGVTLSDMLAAKAIVEDENDRAVQHGGSYHLYVVPDDRLIAAIYALENYDPGFDDENVLAGAMPMKGERGQNILKAIYVVRHASKDERGALQ